VVDVKPRRHCQPQLWLRVEVTQGTRARVLCVRIRTNYFSHKTSVPCTSVKLHTSLYHKSYKPVDIQVDNRVHPIDLFPLSI
jgi:hypothetical protein